MGPKKDNDSTKAKRKNASITIDVRKEIIAKHENGVCASGLGTQFGMAKSTICTALKTRETIQKAAVARGIIVTTKQRSPSAYDVNAPSYRCGKTKLSFHLYSMFLMLC
jgi:IS30 family transposase